MSSESSKKVVFVLFSYRMPFNSFSDICLVFKSNVKCAIIISSNFSTVTNKANGKLCIHEEWHIQYCGKLMLTKLYVGKI